MQIWWGYRLAFDCTLIWCFTHYFSLYPAVIYRHSKQEPVRWTQRRRQFLNNPYFSAPSAWKNRYDSKFNVVGTL